MESNYWTKDIRQRVSRRAVLRGTALAGAGLGAAALLGCGADDEPAPATGTTAPVAPAAPANGVAARAPGGIPEDAIVPSVAGAPTHGGSFIIPVTATYAQHDMHTALGGTLWHAISERAFELDHWTMELKGQAVEEWEILDDQGLELAMHVRPGLAMHDKEPWNGRDFNAEDLAWNLERNAGLFAEREGIPLTSFQRRSMVEGLESAQAIDDRTVLIKMARPNGAIFNGMAEIRTQLMPKEMVDIGFAEPTKMASFGTFFVSDFRSGEREIYERHPNYYQAGMPYFDRIERVALPDRAAIAAAFIDRQVSVWNHPLPHEVQAVQQANRDALYYEWMHMNWDHFRWNVGHGPLADFRVRKAFQLATDLAEINNGYYGPHWHYTAVTHPLYPEAWDIDYAVTLPGVNPATKAEDRAEAARLLSAAGYEDGAGIDLVIVPTTAPVFEEHSLRFMAQMEGLFPQIKLAVQRPSDSAAFATRQAARDFSAICYTITVVPDIFLELHSQYHSDGSRNYGSFEEPVSDGLIDRGLRSLVLEERIEIAEEFQRRYMDEWQANLVLNIRSDNYLLQGNIAGFDATAGTWGFSSYRLQNKAGRWYYV